MVSYLKGCNNVASTVMLILVVFLLYETPGLVSGRINPLVELSKREDLFLQMGGGYGQEKLSTVLISGRVLCQPSYPKYAQFGTEYVAGAVVGVSCHTRMKTSKLSNWVQVETDTYGDFVIDLPSHLHAIPNLENSCVVKVVSLPKSSLCTPFFTGKQAEGLKLSSEKDGIRTYIAQSIYLIQKPSQGCMSKANM